LIERHHPAQDFAATLVRAGRSSVLSLLLIAGLAGCRHKTPQLPYVSMAEPLDLEDIPPPDDLPLIAEEPAPAPIPPPTQPVEPPKPVARRRPAPPKETTTPVQVASAADPALAIGALSSGGESTPQSEQQAKDLIAAIMKRLKALPGKTASQKKDEIRQVSHFLQEAQHALDSGDAEGAKNLATKASLLMDDVEKK
jgi:hypothetical protein